MRTTVQRDHSESVVLILNDHHIARVLLNFEPGPKRGADRPIGEAPFLWIQVLLFGGVIDIGFDVFLLGPSPGLIGNLAVRRVDDAARPSWQRLSFKLQLAIVQHLADPSIAGMGQGIGPLFLRSVEAAHIRLAVGQRRRVQAPDTAVDDGVWARTDIGHAAAKLIRTAAVQSAKQGLEMVFMPARPQG